MKLLILYTEIAAYTMACLEELNVRHPDVEVHLVRWPVNNEAPFKFTFGDSIRIYERKNYNRETLQQLANEIQPDAILCCGWMDRDYFRLCKKWNGKIPVILIMDNKWLGTWKQHVAKLVSRFSILRGFRFVWVPGEAQKKYALKLGFSEKRIRTGFYSANVNFFKQQAAASRQEKKQQFPHRFIYVGRYYDFKGVTEMWEAFAQFKKASANDWELWCLGAGDVQPVEHPAIRHFGFVQPEEMKELMRQTGVFILPSKVEPWGVVVHEFAAAGFPLLLSDQVGAASAFLAESKNGFSFHAGDVKSLVTAFQSIQTLSDDNLFRMGEISGDLAETITPQTWSDTLYDLITSR